ncbi:MAG TPA: PHB depolymerase family esterase [Dehalococcoidia bacterium]|nr:PHB depolymerase family esterase [Dehalococcoidia bacterium]
MLIVAGFAALWGGAADAHAATASQSGLSGFSAVGSMPGFSAFNPGFMGPKTPFDKKASDAAAGCGNAHVQGKSIVEYMFSGGVLRSYRIYVPPSYNPSTPAPLVLGFHGFGANAIEQEYYTNFKPQADLHGFVLVSPNAVGTPPHWNYYGKLAPAMPDDYAFVNDLIDHLQGELCIDAARIYTTGMSDGGTMAAIIGCKLNNRIAAVAPVAGSPYLDAGCLLSGPVPLITFHGTADTLWPFDGGIGYMGLPVTPTETDVLDWAKHNKCDLNQQSQVIATDVTLETYTGCSGNADVELYVIDGGGHTFPGAPIDFTNFGSTTHSIDAAALSWAFFAAHPKAP